MSVFRARLSVEGTEYEVEASTPQELRDAMAKLRDEIGAPSSRGSQRAARAKSQPEPPKAETTTQDPIAIVNAIRGSDLFDAIETKILDKKNQLPRLLMCGYFAEQTDRPHITTTDVETITRELGVRVQASNASTCFSQQGRNYFVSDRTKRKGVPTLYLITRAGIQEFNRLLDESSEGDG
jgi:hypothetical protein